ncbi:cobalamin biosynthesis domain-containing protein [Gluconobacter thailandicus]|uniref:cobalamin biosynthesis protein n=1 Tax=Gluconobacter thailandicus TaxID=257438 RepID=UPI0007780B75|nr:cobalamin biosynthesis protein [Gluconobacter thailandicus]KXV35297.1 cobalamin biosynthesis domain-containing protein [Gluconobacter thailandicus]
MIVAGIGCRPGITRNALLALVQRVAGRHPLDRLAAPAFRQGEAAISDLAKALKVELVWVSALDMTERQVECETHSAIAFEKTGFSSVAEACALAGAGPKSRLLVTRQSDRDVTCALAISTDMTGIENG